MIIVPVIIGYQNFGILCGFVFENNPFLEQVREIDANEDAVVIPVCAAIESELSELEEEDKLDLFF